MGAHDDDALTAQCPRELHLIRPRYHLGMEMTLRLTDEDERVLANLAAEDGISLEEAALRAIRDAAARRGIARSSTS